MPDARVRARDGGADDEGTTDEGDSPGEREEKLGKSTIREASPNKIRKLLNEISQSQDLKQNPLDIRAAWEVPDEDDKPKWCIFVTERMADGSLGAPIQHPIPSPKSGLPGRPPDPGKPDTPSSAGTHGGRGEEAIATLTELVLKAQKQEGDPSSSSDPEHDIRSSATDEPATADPAGPATEGAPEQGGEPQLKRTDSELETMIQVLLEDEMGFMEDLQRVQQASKERLRINLDQILDTEHELEELEGSMQKLWSEMWAGEQESDDPIPAFQPPSLGQEPRRGGPG